jgi:pimeloyl-ACP methyl ester carboxylesterase
VAGVRSAAAAYEGTDLRQRLEKYHGAKTDTLFRAWTETWLHPAFRNWNITQLLPAIACPLLFVQGENDEYGTAEQARQTVNAISGRAELLLLPGLGHTPHKEAPDTVLQAAAAFLRSAVA